MNYKLLSLTLLALPCSAMNIVNIADKDTAKELLLTPAIGGIQSLVSAKKDGTEIVIIGHAHSEGFLQNGLSVGDSQAKDWFIPQLQTWSTLETPTAFITFASESTCKEHAMKQFEKNKQDKTFYMPLLAEIHALAYATNYKHGNVHILCRPYLIDYEELLWDVNIVFSIQMFSHLAKKAKLDTTDLSILNASIQNANPENKRLFFSKEGPFERFKKEAQKALTSLGKTVVTVADYCEILEQTIEEANAVCAQTTNPYLLKEFNTELARLRRNKVEILSYLGSYGIVNQSTGLFDALCSIIVAEQEIKKSIITFMREVYLPVIDMLGLIKHASIITTNYKQVVLLYPYDKTHDLLEFLNAAGYDIEAKGVIPNLQPGERFMLHQSPFSQIETVSFLQKRFGSTSQLHLPLVPEESPLHTIIEDRGQTETLQKLVTLFTQDLETANNTQQKPLTFKKKEKTICRQCSQRVNTAQAQLAETCSYQCLAKHLFLKKGKALKKLLAKQEHSAQEQAVINHLGALCYLRSYTLSPAMCDPQTPFMVKKVLHLLTMITEDKNKDQAWTRALAIAHSAGIDINHLKSFLTIYQGIYTQYLKRKLKNSAVIFDEKESIKKLQEARKKNISTLFNIPMQSSTWHPRVYYTLMSSLGFNPSQLEHALAVKVNKATKKIK